MRKKKIIAAAMGASLLTGCGYNGNETNESFSLVNGGLDSCVSDDLNTTTSALNVVYDEVVTTSSNSSDCVKKGACDNSSDLDEVVDNDFTNCVESDFADNSSDLEVNDLSDCVENDAYDSEFIDFLNSNCDVWIYRDYREVYVVQNDDTIASLCEKFNLTEGDLLSHNPHIGEDNFYLNDVGTVTYPITYEYYYLPNDSTSLEYISLISGVDAEELRYMNGFGYEFDKTSGITNVNEISVHKYIGNSCSYETNYGVVNRVYGKRIFGDKVVYCSGYSGSFSDVLVMTSDPMNYGMNEVYLYEFDDSNFVDKVKLCSNAKDISCDMSGYFDIVLRNDSDVRYLAECANSDDYFKFMSSNYDESFLSYGDDCVLHFDDAMLHNSKQYVR